MKNFIPILLIVIVIFPCCNRLTKNQIKKENLYLGQTSPGLTPEVFAPGIVSTDAHEFSCTMAPDGKAFYFTRKMVELNSNRIVFTHWKEDHWTEPKIMPVAGDYDGMEPYVSYDGKKLFFQTWRPFGGNAQPSMDIWMMEKNENEWGEPIHLDAPFNPAKSMFISMSNNHTIYTTDISNGFNPTRIVYSELKDGQYQAFKSVGELINSTGSEIYPCISPDESFLLFSRNTADGKKIFISFKQSDGQWGEPVYVDLGELPASMPRLSPDGKYLFFTSVPERLKGDIYWVDAQILKDLKPDSLK